MKIYKNSEAFDQATFDKIINILMQAEDLIPKLVPVQKPHPDENYKTGVANIPFVKKAYEIARNNPQFLPQHLNLDTMKKNLDYDIAMVQIERHLLKLTERVTENRMDVGCEAMKKALTIYAQVKQAVRNKIPGAESAQESLDACFILKKNNLSVLN